MIRRAVLGAIVTVCATGCGPRGPAPTMLRSHPDLQARVATTARVAVLPPRVEVTEMGFDDDATRLRSLEDQLEAEVREVISARLRERNFTVQEARLEPGYLAEQRALRFQLSELFQSYDQLSWRVYRKGAQPPDEARRCSATMGTAVNPFSDRADADALLFTNMAAMTKSSGLKSRDGFYQVLAALGGVYVQTTAAVALMEVALVDGTTGELLWSNRVAATYRRSIEAPFLVDLALRDFPSGPVTTHVATPADH